MVYEIMVIIIMDTLAWYDESIFLIKIKTLGYIR